MTVPLGLKRSRCAAGHKAMWHEKFGGLPPEEFLVKIDPLLAVYAKDSLRKPIPVILLPATCRKNGLHAWVSPQT
jgi:ribulose kinase